VRTGLILLVLVVSTVLAADPVPDEIEPEIYRLGALEITDPWASAAIGDAHSAKIFFEFRNLGPRADQLLSAQTPVATAAATFKLVTPTDGDAAVRAIRAIEFPAGGDSFELSRHGCYIELTGLQMPLTMGKRFPLELVFAEAGTLRIEVTSRFHSPKLTRRVRAAARAGDAAELRRLRDAH